jgi:hypothetical protein
VLHDLIASIQAFPKLFAELQLVFGLLVADAEDGRFILVELLRRMENLSQELSLLGLEGAAAAEASWGGYGCAQVVAI